MASSYFGNYTPGRYGEESQGVAGGGSVKYPVLESGGYVTRFGPGDNDWTLTPNSRSSSGGSRVGGGGGGGGSRQTITRTIFNGKAPELPDLPTLTMPKPDKRKIRALTQEISAPAVRKLREGLQGAMNVNSDNPNVRRMTLREALQGYGTGLESAMAGAGSQARQEHQQELNLLAQEAQKNWQAKTESMMTAYNNAYKTYLESATKESTTNESGGAGGGVGFSNAGPGDLFYKRDPGGNLQLEYTRGYYDRRTANALGRM